MPIRWLCLALLTPLACSKSIDDRDGICLYPADMVDGSYEPSEPPEPLNFVAGAPLAATAYIIHSGGEKLRDMHCSIERHGDTIELHTHYRDPARDPQDNVEIFRVSCNLAELPAGTYTVVYADEEMPLTVPSTAPPVCLGNIGSI